MLISMAKAMKMCTSINVYSAITIFLTDQQFISYGDGEVLTSRNLQMGLENRYKLFKQTLNNIE